MIVSPILLYQNSKKIFSQNVSTLSVSIKIFLLFLIAIFLIDNVFEFSQNIIINSKIDTLKHLSEVSKKQYVEDYDALNQEIVNSRNVFAKTVDSFSFYTNNDNRVPVINTLTVAIIPLVLIVILLFHIVEDIVIKANDQLERLLNMVLLLACAFSLIHVMLTISYVIPTFPEGFVWGNYVLNLFFSLLLFLLICGVITNLSEKIIDDTAPQVDTPAAGNVVEEQENQEAAEAADVQPDAQ